MPDTVEKHTICSFHEFMEEFCYSYSKNHKMIQVGDFYIVDRLTVGPDFMEYKEVLWHITPRVYNDVKRFYEFLQSTELSSEEISDLQGR